MALGPQVMIAHQRVVRDINAERERHESPAATSDLSAAKVLPCSFVDAKKIIQQYEWLGTMPSGFRCAYGIYWPSKAGDLFSDGWVCGGVVVFGSPNPMQIAKSVCGPEHKGKVIQLHRGACVWWAHPHAASFLISRSLLAVGKLGWRVVVAFADEMAGEVGTVYQATNWLYAGMTAKRPDYHVSGGAQNGRRVVGNFKVHGRLEKRDRPRKRRYVYILGATPEKKRLRAALRWPVQGYEKREAPQGERP